LYQIFGAEAIEAGAIRQMETAMKLPVTVAGALMPDAHQGYGLPIGGVLATNNAVIPYAVGVDIGCRMCLSLYDLPVSMLDEKKEELKKLLLNNTKFGVATFKKPKDHEVLEHNAFKEISLIKELKDRAWRQLGSSGGGNHFVEFGIVEIVDAVNEYNVVPGKYLALLSHSGSRGLGATIAGHYTKIAMKQCELPQEAKHLAWLDLATEAGQEYWMAMNLAGDYASACHHQIHERMAIGLRTKPVAMIENHHNFAWKEKDVMGNEIIVHRKGATPAGEGVLGVIPGSMATPGFIVRGKGQAASINSASHGAGRTMSRTRAKQTIPMSDVHTFLVLAGVEVIGSGLDEAPMAYKNIHKVMEYQKDLIHVHGTFMPKIVRMCGDEKFQEVD
jgi:tRNA-splicing ligase RtcB